MKHNKLAAAIILVCSAFSSSAHADPPVPFNHSVFWGSDENPSNGLNIATTAGNFFVPTSASGWWRNGDGLHEQINSNYIAGELFDFVVNNYNNFFTFDLSSITGSVLSASLTLYTYDTAGPDPLVYSLFDIISPLSDVRADGHNLSIYNDLMSGANYGSFSYSHADEDKIRSITLNDAGIGALNSALGGEFGIGGSVAPIPEPETYAMLLAGLGLIGWVAYRRKSA